MPASADGDIARFLTDLTLALGRPLAAGERLALAVSGGPDSMAMLVLAAAALPGQVIAATFDHGLRPASAGEAAMVAGYCGTVGIPHATLVPAEPLPRTNVHAKARSARYAALSRWAIGAGAHVLATAHHADDQAETFLMRAARGSGVAGLGGIRALQAPSKHISINNAGEVSTVVRPALVRPLLQWRASELRAIALAADVPFVDDPSNTDDRFDRTRFRAWLRSAPWLDPAGFVASAAHAAEADATLRAMEILLWNERLVVAGAGHQIRIDLADLPREIKRRLARTAILQVRAANGIVRPAFDDATSVEPLLDALDAGKAATQAGILVTPAGMVWRFAPAPPRRSH